MKPLPQIPFSRLFVGGSDTPWNNEWLIREELFSIERLEQHAASLALAQKVANRSARSQSLTNRLKDNSSILLNTYRTIAGSLDNNQPLTPAAEWLLDNYHIVEEQIREIHDDLPPGYYRQLPKLADGPFAGYPRVFGIAWAFVAHTDSLFEPEMLRRFVRAYQEVVPLTIGELWAIAITLRIVLVENLRRAAVSITAGKKERQEADFIANQLLNVQQAKSVDLIVQRYQNIPLSTTFALQLVHRLRDRDPKVTPALLWVDNYFASKGTTVEQVVHDEHQNQVAVNITIRNIITSMRLMSNLDWADWFESVSLVDVMLRSSSNFANMDFSTRNLYRSAIEELSRGSKLAELEITRFSLLSAINTELPGHPHDIPRKRDPGYYLIAGGRKGFEKKIDFKAPRKKRIPRLISSLGIIGYIGLVTFVTLVVMLLPFLLLTTAHIHGLWLAVLIGLSFIPSVDAAISLVNRSLAGELNATCLPGLRLNDDIPVHLRTIIAIPTLLTSPVVIKEQIEQLEVHSIANPEDNLYFALLSDWPDADSEETEDDARLLKVAVEGIAELNRRYPLPSGDARFILLHRRRLWNEQQQKWMGWERKRGKLHELNQWLRGVSDTTFIQEASSRPLDIRYVITLDSDTKMPLDTARRLIGKMAHPLNRPQFDAAVGRIVDGYAILQPRITPSLPMVYQGSIFQRIFSRTSGLNPYASAVSDVYQDFFGEGSYAGKGIYDIDAFEMALIGHVPENSMLSHDLFEGVFARAGLVSDIEVVEEFPWRYDVHSARQHRWARGDWQLLPWILQGLLKRKSQTADDKNMPLIGIWKMLDNLRRTLSAPASLLALMVGWTLPLSTAILWTIFIVAILSLPTFLPVFSGLLPRHSRITAGSHWQVVSQNIGIALFQTLLLIAFLPHQTWLMLDAIFRTLYRLFISHRNLLEWVTAAQTRVSSHLNWLGFYQKMMLGISVASIIGLVIGLRLGSGHFSVIASFVILWLVSPMVARWVSVSPAAAKQLQVTSEDALHLRLIARRTWHFFETFVTPADNMLPPDNFQEEPKPVVAHRTSPTNIGLYLLSAVNARDFGWMGLEETIQRLEATLATINQLQKFRGHLYNWYDTQDLRPLEPHYVSSVDSGNLAGHLLTLANVCQEWANDCSPNPEVFNGIADNMRLVRQALEKLPDNRRTQTVTRDELESSVYVIERLLEPTLSSGQSTLSERLMRLMTKARIMSDMVRAVATERGDEHSIEMLSWAEATRQSLEGHYLDSTQSERAIQAQKQRLLTLETKLRALVSDMAFGFLLDPDRKLLSIGYLVNENQLDQSCYDLLASEARLASFIGIAKGDISLRHWFRLGRPVTPIRFGAALISWSGSMFEYLMPSLVMRTPIGSFLEQTNRLVVSRQISYGAALGVPWGISESAYNARDLEMTYQYSNFGVPGLGLKRGLRDNIVIAPYATALAAMIDPTAATRNFIRLAKNDTMGRYGFYEAVDYTRSRLPEDKTFVIVRAYMAHHQGMSIVSIANTLLDGIMRSRFHSEPMVQAAELLLQERTPQDVAVSHPRAEEVRAITNVRDLTLPMARTIHSVHTTAPITHLLSNGRYTVMLTGAGSGYSQWNHLAVTRWREDVTRDGWGSYIFLRDSHSGNVWSAGYQPTATEANHYKATFSEERAEFIRRDGLIMTKMDVVVSSEDDAEVRRISISNTDSKPREIEVTSYAELVMAPSAAEKAHPAFSKLFVQTEYLSKLGVLLATRRRRAPTDPEIWTAHLSVVEGETTGEIEIETDRARFLGRTQNTRTPIAIRDGRPLTNTVGTVLDPVFAIRRRLVIQPGATARIAFWTVISSSRASVLDLVDKHQDANAFDRAVMLAWTQAQVQLHHLNMTQDDANLFQSLGGHILYTNPLMRSSADKIRSGAGSASGLWVHSISGDIPIVLVRIDEIENISIVRQLLRAHEYLRMKQLAFDLVILNERTSSYVQDLQTALETMVRTSQLRPIINENGTSHSVFILRKDLISPEARALLLSVARVVLDGHSGTLSEQLMRFRESKHVPALIAKCAASASPSKNVALTPDLEFFNGLGGFDKDGREYVTILGAGQSTPAPWINVIANPCFGFQTSVEGSGYTWSLNSRENQLTPWSNDPVTDCPGEVIYVRDEDTDLIWGPTALPVRDDLPYTARHGAGYSRFEHTAHGIALDLLQYVPIQEDAIKISRLTLNNTSGRTRRLSVTAYVEWLLGQSRDACASHIITDTDSETGALFARNPWNPAFPSRVAFMDLGGRQTDWTGDRQEFIGRNGSLDNPAGLLRKIPLSRRLGAGLDPCGVLQTFIELKPNESIEIVFFLGQAESQEAAQSLITRYRSLDFGAVFEEVVHYWDTVLGSIQVKTPDRSMDILLNRWLLYQTLSCRIWARSAFYQASGAYGFRDQLQDGMALTSTLPAFTRAHLLRAAARQFVEGDFQHWWLPHNGQGVRTRISDDRVWMAYATAHYIETTGDVSILDETISFLEGELLDLNAHDAYFLPHVTDAKKSLFEHCALALDQSLMVGAHGLPLIGTGDWNDGMNRVGEMGKGESVWLGWFLLTTLSAFLPLAESRMEIDRVSRWKDHSIQLQSSIEQEGWDGDWYRRGYFDDGTPLGSATSSECQIDAIAQSWSVISGAADPARARHAMAAVEKHLIRQEEKLALLFTPPFDKMELDPGYIKGYPPGLRENGGQYSHAAMWSIIAFAKLGEGDKAAQLFSMMNPINHTNTRAGMHRYKVEPYVIAADVYSVAPHIGRGGWTWYTGAAGWMYRAGIESILGCRRQGSFLIIDPCIPKHWPGFEILYQFEETSYTITVENPHGVNQGILLATSDQEPLPKNPLKLPLVNDRLPHRIDIVLG